MHKARGCTGLAGHTGIGVVGQNFVQNGIRDLVADLVGMSLGDGLRSKQVSCQLFCLLKFLQQGVYFLLQHSVQAFLREK